MSAEVLINIKLFLFLLAAPVALILTSCQTPSQKPSPSWPQIAKISPEIMAILDDQKHFKEVHTTKALPPDVLALCYAYKNDIADPGQDFNSTDVIVENRPSVRLDWGATNGSYY